MSEDRDLLIDSLALARWVRRERERVGLTQTELAARMNRQPKTVSNMETGRMRRLPGPDLVDALTQALGVTERQFLRDMGYLKAEARAEGGEQPAPSTDLVFTAMMRDLDRTEDLGPVEREVIREAIQFARRIREAFHEDGT